MTGGAFAVVMVVSRESAIELLLFIYPYLVSLGRNPVQEHADEVEVGIEELLVVFHLVLSEQFDVEDR